MNGRDHHEKASEEIKTYFTTIPAHKFMYIKNISDRDIDALSGLFAGIKSKSDHMDSGEVKGGITAYIHNSDVSPFL